MAGKQARSTPTALAAVVRPVAYSYVRFSTPEQSQGDSYRRQIEKARSYAARNDLFLDETFRDEGVSAFKGKNRKESALKRFVDLVEARKVQSGSYLLVELLDRLSREEVVDALEFFLRLMRLGLTVVTIGDSEHAYSRESLRGDHTQLLTSIIVMMRAHEESATKSDRVGRAWAAKRDRALATGQAMTARCPAWIRLVGGPRTGHYELIEDRAAHVKRWFDKTIRGFGRRVIVREMNADKVPTWGPGKRWHDSYIQKVLSNPATYGVFVPLSRLAGGGHGAAEPIEKYFPAVVDEATFRKAQAASKERGSGRGRTSLRRRNLLRGIAKCQACGAGMVFIDKGKRSRGPVLKCGNAHEAGGCEQTETYPYALVEVGVLVGLGARRAELATNATSVHRRAEDALVAATARRDEAKARHEMLLDLALKGVSVPIDRMKKSGGDVDALEKAVVEAGAALDRAKLSDPDVDVADIVKNLRRPRPPRSGRASTRPRHDARQAEAPGHQGRDRPGRLCLPQRGRDHDQRRRVGPPMRRVSTGVPQGDLRRLTPWSERVSRVDRSTIP